MQARLGTIVCKFGRDPAICLREEAIFLKSQVSLSRDSWARSRGAQLTAGYTVNTYSINALYKLLTYLVSVCFYFHNSLLDIRSVCVKYCINFDCLDMTEPPHISDDVPGNVSVVEGSTVTVQCPAEGRPTPHISWLKDEYPLSGNEIGVRILADGSLQLDHAEASDAGRYTCLAQNVAGNTSKDFDLQVFCESARSRIYE